MRRLSFASLAFLAACGGAAPASPSAPATPAPADEAAKATPQEDLRTVEEAEDAIAQAEAVLVPGKRKAPPQRPAESRDDARSAEKKDDGCREGCRALASMQRAVTALCRLTGDGSAKCVEARRTLEESTSRLASCACPF